MENIGFVNHFAHLLQTTFLTPWLTRPVFLNATPKTSPDRIGLSFWYFHPLLVYDR